VAAPAPKIEAPVAKPATVAASAAAVAPAIEKPQPKKPEAKPQGKWKPVTVPKEEEAPVAEAKPVVKAEPKPEPKAEPRPQPMMAAPSFSYDAKSDGDEGKKSPMMFIVIGVVAVVVIIAGYFLFGRSSKPAAAPAATTTSAPASATPAATAPATTPTSTANSKPEPAKNEKTPDKSVRSAPADTTIVTRPAPAPLVVASNASAAGNSKAADVAPPSIAFGGGAGPALDVPVTTSAPKLSAPAPANAVIVPSRLLQRVNPNYPSAAKQYRIEGAVSVSATIGPDGHVIEAKVLSGPPMLRDSAISAVKQWRYAPSTVNGRPVESSVNIVLQFKMP
jgi:TonB family protein